MAWTFGRNTWDPKWRRRRSGALHVVIFAVSLKCHLISSCSCGGKSVTICKAKPRFRPGIKSVENQLLRILSCFLFACNYQNDCQVASIWYHDGCPRVETYIKRIPPPREIPVSANGQAVRGRRTSHTKRRLELCGFLYRQSKYGVETSNSIFVRVHNGSHVLNAEDKRNFLKLIGRNLGYSTWTNIIYPNYVHVCTSKSCRDWVRPILHTAGEVVYKSAVAPNKIICSIVQKLYDWSKLLSVLLRFAASELSGLVISTLLLLLLLSKRESGWNFHSI